MWWAIKQNHTIGIIQLFFDCSRIELETNNRNIFGKIAQIFGNLIIHGLKK
jgi:hypothetical protein